MRLNVSLIDGAKRSSHDWSCPFDKIQMLNSLLHRKMGTGYVPYTMTSTRKR